MIWIVPLIFLYVIYNFFHYALSRQSKPRRTLLDQNAPKRGTQQFVAHAANCDDSLPSYWTNSGHRLIRVNQQTEAAIKDAIVRTWDPSLVGMGRDARGLSKCGIEVLSVSRLEDPNLYREYFKERKKMFARAHHRGKLCSDIKRLPASRGRASSTEALPSFMKRELYWEINEQYLFHGTKADNVQSILSKGLDPSYCSPSGMFGQAVYTTDCFTKADQYTDRGSGNDLYMILSRVVLGKVFVCARREQISYLRGPPCTKCHVYQCSCWFKSRFDSIMADGEWLFREFVLHHKNRCYPEYVIKYRRQVGSNSPCSYIVSVLIIIFVLYLVICAFFSL